jgi:hypothetical protein
MTVRPDRWVTPREHIAVERQLFQQDVHPASSSVVVVVFSKNESLIPIGDS